MVNFEITKKGRMLIAPVAVDNKKRKSTLLSLFIDLESTKIND